MPELDLVVFDIAGTTIRASDQVPAAFKAAFARFDIELSDDAIEAIRGKSKHEAIAQLLNERRGSGRPDTATVYECFQTVLMQKYEAEGIEAIDGAHATFNWLKAGNIKIALNTGFDRNLAEPIVRTVGWERIVDALVCNDDVARGRPAPDLIMRAMEWTTCDDPRRVAAVGDTVSDLEAASNAGVGWIIGVSSGAHSAELLRSCPHTAVIPSVADLPEVLVSD